ncbi:MAG TPA: hypothetical protein PK849_13170, partial [Synergistales bacterium]|nr:hypothetical protein [Synergistales bacterium]
TQTDPRRWFEWATLVCAGSTSAVEAVLAHRPTVVFSGYWIGLLTPETLDEAFASYFGERSGPYYVRHHLEKISAEIQRVYDEWESERMERDLAAARAAVEPRFRREGAATEFERLFRSLA